MGAAIAKDDTRIETANWLGFAIEARLLLSCPWFSIEEVSFE